MRCEAHEIDGDIDFILIGQLEDNDDVQHVTANFEVSDALIAKMEG